MNGLLVRGTRALIVLAVFLLYATLCPRLFEGRAEVTLEGRERVRISGFGNEPPRAQSAANEAAQRTLVRASFAPARDAGTRARAEGALASFVDAHPTLLVPPPPPAPAPGADILRVRLEKERERVNAQLAAIQRGARLEPASADNPFEEGSGPSAALLKRRLVEIDRSLTASERAARTPPNLPGLDEFKTLLSAVALTSADPSPAPLRGRVVEARRPEAPVDPERGLLLAVALAWAAGVALLPTKWRRARPRLVEGPSLPPPVSVSAVVSVAPAVANQAIPAEVSLRPAASPGASPVLAYPTQFIFDPTLDAERYGDLKRQLGWLSERECFVLAVTATARAPAGKTRVAAGLATAFYDHATARVLLLEADLANPTLCNALALNVPTVTDFAGQLQARVQGSSDQHWYVLKCSPALHVLASITRGPELLLTTYFEKCIANLRPFYDVIIVHAPPLSDVVGCHAVSDVVDGVALAFPEGDPAAGGSVIPFTGKRITIAVPVASKR